MNQIFAVGRPKLFRFMTRSLVYVLFLLALSFSAFDFENGGPWINPDIFARMDPLAALTVPMAARDLIPALWPGLLVLASALFFGRFFCSHVCPMGTTLDIGSFCATKLRGKGPRILPALNRERWNKARFWLLSAIIGAALLGVNLAFWAAPMPLVNRFYATALHPLLTLAGHTALVNTQPLADSLSLTSLAYAQISPRRFEAVFFILSFFGLLFWLEIVRPRFWCRFLCPAGALMGLLSLLAFWRPRVNSECVECGLCAKACPAECRGANGQTHVASECLGCRECLAACPKGAITFMPTGAKTDISNRLPGRPPRRGLLVSLGAGAGLAMASMIEAKTHVLPGERGLLWDKSCIRPPGAVPEPEFLARCERCALCMKACPTNGLQPDIFQSGTAGLFTPLLAARRGPCEPGCRACGQVCPTGAVRNLTLRDKQWAKVGTAVVHRERCLAWEQGKRCVVCQEVCPYGSVELLTTPGISVPVPFVRAEKCFGCGYCENHCPVRLPAIEVEPLNAMRLKTGAYEEAGKKAGLSLEPSRKDETYPGAEEPSSGGLPPGFTE